MKLLTRGGWIHDAIREEAYISDTYIEDGVIRAIGKDLEVAQDCPMKTYCVDKGIPCADFRTPFLGPEGLGRRELYFDGLHPTAEGHELMAQVMCRTLEQLR